jgi:hypothetical protein
MRLALIADADFNQDLVRGVLRYDGSIDFLNASEGGTRGLPDRQVLERLRQRQAEFLSLTTAIR